MRKNVQKKESVFHENLHLQCTQKRVHCKLDPAIAAIPMPLTLLLNSGGVIYAASNQIHGRVLYTNKIWRAERTKRAFLCLAGP